MKIVIKDSQIKIGQLLKKINIISTGGQAKYYLENNIVKVNGKRVKGRGTQVPVGATLWINDELYQVVNE